MNSLWDYGTFEKQSITIGSNVTLHLRDREVLKGIIKEINETHVKISDMDSTFFVPLSEIVRCFPTE